MGKVARRSSSHGAGAEPPAASTPFEKWVAGELQAIKADVSELKTDVGKLLHHFGIVSGGQP